MYSFVSLQIYIARPVFLNSKTVNTTSLKVVVPSCTELNGLIWLNLVKISVPDFYGLYFLFYRGDATIKALVHQEAVFLDRELHRKVQPYSMKLLK